MTVTMVQPLARFFMDSNYKCQIYVEGNDIEGNAGGQVNCDSLCGSSFRNNHLENSRSVRVPPMSFGSRPLLESSAGTTTGKNADFSRIADGDTLIIKVDGDDSVTITFSD